MERLSDKARMYAGSYGQPPYGWEIDGTAGLLLQMADKLEEYEEFEKIFRSRMTDAACDFLGDKEEFAKWLDRNKWITKKCDEYARAEEQGKLIKLPCKVGDMTYSLNKAFRDVVDAIVERIEIDSSGFWVITSAGIYSFDDFSKTVFLIEEEAKAALREIIGQSDELKCVPMVN